VEEFRTKAGSLGIDVMFEVTRGPGDGVRLARELAAGADVLGIIGGDGTVHEAVNGIMPTPLPIVIVPVGSGNDFASLMGCPSDAEGLLEVIRRGRGARIDVLDYGIRFGVNSAGLGFEGIVNRYSHDIRHLKGSMLYLAAVFRALNKLECPRFRLTTPDGMVIEGNKLIVSVGNGNRTGGAFYLTPDAYPDDGLIDVCLVEKMGRLRVLALLPTSLRGSHVHRPQVQMLRVESLVLESEPGYPMHIDGELIDPAPERLDITLLKRALPVLCDDSIAGSLKHPLEKLL
jgi:YegS/Rv2252/BmrU family lipid kinase